MNVNRILDGKNLTIAIEGRLDSITSPPFEAKLKEMLQGIESLTLDFEQLEYVSSAGLRVILAAQKTMNRQGKMRIIRVNESVREVFDMTGFTEFLTIE